MLLKLANNNQIRPSTMKLNNRYEYNPATDLLGKGGFARVYKAQDLLLNRTVALKVFTGMGHQYSVLEEIKKAIQLDHPNLLRFYDVLLLEQTNVVGETEQTQIGVMELANAGDLKDFARANPGSPLLYKLLKDVLLGLEYLHSKGIIHRDLKAQNILLVKQDGQLTAKISDFGISKDTGSGGQSSSMMVGTIEYMAPEQFSPAKYGIDGKVGSNLDLWSFGIMVHELLTNTTPFGSRDGDTTAEQIMSQILSTEMPDGIDKLPEPYKSVVKKCLVTNAKERIRRASELVNYFEHDTPLKSAVQSSQVGDDATKMYPKEGQSAQPNKSDDDATRLYPKAEQPKNIQQAPENKRKTRLIAGVIGLVVSAAGLSLWIKSEQENKAALQIQQDIKTKETAQAKAVADAQAKAQAAAETAAIEAKKGGQIIKDCADCPEMVVIPAGSFMMGSPASEKDRGKNEGPQRTVIIKAFAMGKTEVTQGQWKAIMGNNPSNFKNCGDECPVEEVSWNDAQGYIKKLNAMTGKAYSLPSEAQWEYAARAGTTTDFHTGNTISAKQANFGSNKTIKVASLNSPNAFGLHDMHGNVWEWTQDVWHDNYTGAPTDGSAWLDGGNQMQRVLRGGSWFNGPQYLRSASRNRFTPDFSINFIGFRLARTL
jgi:formylglycine-generating enzyme required for sulfatase activity/serine/threonine protein kinase